MIPSLLLAVAPLLQAASAEPLRVALDSGWELAPEQVVGERPPAEAWRPAVVPGTFEAQLGSDFEGVVWYRRRIEQAAPAAGPRPRYRVDFRAAATEATVFWQGLERGRHLGGWTPFAVDLPAGASGGLEGLLEVRLDELGGHDTQGFLPIIQPHFGGLWQEVELVVSDGPTLERERSLLFGDGRAGLLRCRVPVRRRAADGGLDVAVELREAGRSVSRRRVELPAEGPAELTLAVPDPRLWAPGAPELYDARVELHPRGEERVLDRHVARVGFRHVASDGTTLLWNGRPLQVRGMLHWGFSPPDFAPSPDPARWRRELELLRDLGCNLVKCCLWVPPKSYYEVADELGILVWQEYPTWHAQLTLERLPGLAREFDEFFAHDRSHPSVALRSLTCETGADVDVEVLQSLYEAAHAAVPNSLVIDNSSWISWMRVHDFWDDHPYGNNGWWPGKLAKFREFIAQRRALPLVFGECIASDTWFDRPAWERETAGEPRWYEPWCLAAQVEFEERLARRFGHELVAELLPVSKRYALRNRKYQVERLRLDIPDAGYVLSVLRDFPKARMGFVDDLGRPKWTPQDWAWHGDVMLCLDSPGDRRAFPAGEELALQVRVSNFGARAIEGVLELELEGPGPTAFMHTWIERVEPGTVHEGGRLIRDPSTVKAPTRQTLVGELKDREGRRLAVNRWDLWTLPEAPAPAAVEPRIVSSLDLTTLEHLEAGGRVLLRANPGRGSLTTSGLWYLRGAPWAPSHPLDARVPRELLTDLQGFDLEQPFVLHGEHLMAQVDPILGFWDTHDIREVRSWLFLAETRVGQGRLLVSALEHRTAAGAWLERELLRHLTEGPAPQRSLSAATLAGLRATLTGEELELATWRFRTDPEDAGLEAGWASGEETGEGWRDMPAGRHWEAEGVSHDGVAWYAISVEVPAAWEGRPVHAVFEGVDDSYHLFVNGQLVARHGDPETGETVWLVRTSAELTDHLEYGATNRLVLRVVDHTGAGGLHRRAFVTTGAVDPAQGAGWLNR